MKILLIGFGFVGKATFLLNNKDIEFFIFDIDPSLCYPSSLNKDTLNDFSKNMDIIFIALPTPTNIDGSCYTNLIDYYIENLNHPFIVIRSTVPIGYCDSKSVFFMPEFLTEKNWKNDFITNSHWMFGIYENCEESLELAFKNKIKYLIESAFRNGSIDSNNIVFGKNKEMEMNKLIRNTFLSTKVSYFNEIYDLTNVLNIDYNKVIEFVSLDDRIGKTHMMCPGHDSKRGFGGTCFPKDTSSLYFQLINNNIPSFILQSCMDRNENYDRIERDWLHDINRTNIGKNMSKIILVTDGMSNLSKNLCKHLVNDSTNKVICLVESLESSSYFQELENYSNFKLISFDLKNKLFFPHIDEIYHIITINQQSKFDFLNKCFEGTKNILELAKKHKANLMLVSTKNEESDTNFLQNLPIEEQHIYNESKNISETLAYSYHKKYNIDYKKVFFYNNEFLYENTLESDIYKN